MLGVSDCVADCVWVTIPQTTEWQRIGNQIDAAMIFTGSGEDAGSGAASELD